MFGVGIFLGFSGGVFVGVKFKDAIVTIVAKVVDLAKKIKVKKGSK